MAVLVEPRADARERPPQIRLAANNLTQIVHMQETGDNSGQARHAAPQIPHRAREASALDGKLPRRARAALEHATRHGNGPRVSIRRDLDRHGALVIKGSDGRDEATRNPGAAHSENTSARKAAAF